MADVACLPRLRPGEVAGEVLPRFPWASSIGVRNTCGGAG